MRINTTPSPGQSSPECMYEWTQVTGRQQPTRAMDQLWPPQIHTSSFPTPRCHPNAKKATLSDRRETRHLKKGLWGLVQARRIWNEELNSHVESEGFPVTLKDPAVYVKGFRNREDLAAGEGDFVRVGPGKGLDVLSKGKI